MSCACSVHDWQQSAPDSSVASRAGAIECTRPEALPRAPSAAQNETVIQTCMQCGAINGAEARTCCLCDTRLSKYADAISVSPRPQLRNEGSVPVETDWRSEVSQRLEAYRERHGSLRDSGLQPELAFTPPISPEPEPEPMLV